MGTQEDDLANQLMRFLAPGAFELAMPDNMRRRDAPNPSQPRIIKFAPNVTTLVLDVGARESASMITPLRGDRWLGRSDVAVVTFEPVNENYAWLYHHHKLLPPEVAQRRHIVPAAVGARNSVGLIHLSKGPACSSLLPTSKENKFWCHDSVAAASVPVVTLESFFRLLPPGMLDGGHGHYLKVDAEGADLDVLRGAGIKQLAKFRGITIECHTEALDVHHIGECVEKDAIDFMVPDAFSLYQVVPQGGSINIHYANSQRDLAWAVERLRALEKQVRSTPRS